MSRNKLQKVLDIKFIIAVIIIILLCAVLVYTRKEAKSNYVSDEKITEIGFENIGVGFHAGFGAVQIHHMDPLRPGLPEGLRGSQGILRHPVGGGEIPLHQPHALAVLYVDSGENQHSGDQSFLTVAGPPF